MVGASVRASGGDIDGQQMTQNSGGDLYRRALAMQDSPTIRAALASLPAQ